MPGGPSRKRNAQASRPRRGENTNAEVGEENQESQATSSTPPGSPPARRIRMTAAQSRELETLFANGHPSSSQRQEIANNMGLSIEQVVSWCSRRRRAPNSVRSTGESNSGPGQLDPAPSTSRRRGHRRPAPQPETSSDEDSEREEIREIRREDRQNEPLVDNINQEENANAEQVSAWFGRRPALNLAVRRREPIIEPSRTPNNDNSEDNSEEYGNRSPLPSPGYTPFAGDERYRSDFLPEDQRPDNNNGGDESNERNENRSPLPSPTYFTEEAFNRFQPPEDQRGSRTRRRALSDHSHILAEQMSYVNPTDDQPSTSLALYDGFLIPNYRTTSVEETTQRIQDSTGTLQSLMPPISPEQSTSRGRVRNDNSRRRPGMTVYDGAAEISRTNAMEQEAAASTGRSSPHSPELEISPRRDRSSRVISIPAWNEMVGTIHNINATPLSPLSRARREERRNPTSPTRPPISIAVRQAESLVAQLMRQAYNNNNDANEPRAAPPTYVMQNVGREYPLPTGPPPMYTRPAPRTPRENVFTIPADVAIPQAVSDSFGPEGLKDDDDEEVTDIEEMVFQKLLRKKMVCEICMTHMKQFRCSKCFYSMCKICTDTISKEHAGPTPCPQCRKAHKQFLPIILPRL